MDLYGLVEGGDKNGQVATAVVEERIMVAWASGHLEKWTIL